MTAGVDQSDFDQRLVIQMRGADFVATATKPGEPPIAARAFTEDLQAVLMLDSAETLSTVSVETLKAQGLSEDEAFQIAIGNTRDRMGAVSSQSYDNMTVLSSENGSFRASCLCQKHAVRAAKTRIISSMTIMAF